MPKITDKPLRRVIIRVFDEDYQKAKELFGPNIGLNKAWRTAIHAFMTQTEAKIRAKVDEMEGDDND